MTLSADVVRSKVSKTPAVLSVEMISDMGLDLSETGVSVLKTRGGICDQNLPRAKS